MAELQNHKVTFYADAEVKKWLDKLGTRGKSPKINELLRKGFEKGDEVLPQLDVLEPGGDVGGHLGAAGVVNASASN